MAEKDKKKPENTPEKKEAKESDADKTDVPFDIDEAKNIERILGLQVLVNVNIGTIKMNLKEVLELIPGSIIEVQKNIEEPLALSVNNRKDIAQGEVVSIGESLGIRVLQSSHL